MQRRALLSGGSALVAASLAGCIASGSVPIKDVHPDEQAWPLPRYDSHNRSYNPHASPPRNEVTRRWEQLNYGELYGLVGAGDIVVAYGERGIWGFDVSSGEERWAREGATYAAAIFDDHVYTCGQDGFGASNPKWVRTYDLASGDPGWEWTEEATGYLVDVLATDTWVFVGDESRVETLVFDRESGERRWTIEPGGILGVADEQLIVASQHALVCFALESGWISNELARTSAIEPISHTGHSAPVYTTQYLLRGELVPEHEPGDSAVHAYDIRSERKEWTSEPRRIQTATPAVVEDVGFAVQSNRESPSDVVALNLVDGGQRWHETVESDLHEVRATDELVLVAGATHGQHTGRLVAFDHDGTRRWEAAFNGRPSWRSGVIAMGDAIYVSTGRGEIISLEAA